MVQNYSEVFKLEACGYLELLKDKGTINLKGVQIKNVRQLVAFLGISSYSIYKWYKQIQYLARNMDLEDVKEDLKGMMDAIEIRDAREFIKEHDGEDFDNGFEVDFVGGNLDDHNGEDFFEDPHDYPSETYNEGIFNGRFYAWLANGVNVPNSFRNAKATNMLKIGLELIKRSGLVDCDKVKRAMGGK